MLDEIQADEQELMLDEVKSYYGSVLKSSSDLKTSACCLTEKLPEYIASLVRQVHPEVCEKFYGCGSPIPTALAGCTVLDLGCGSGRDCYVISSLVGEEGRVIGIDMTDEQLEVARRHQGHHAKLFGYRQSNVEFRQGYIEDLAAVGIESNSVDVVISNCVINLSPDKTRVFSEIFRVLKPGGELYFSDVYADRRVPPALARDPVLLGECLGGALYLEDFRRLLAKCGCADWRTISRTRITMTNDEIAAKAGAIGFYSATIRAFKLALEDRCEDYGQVAYYLGTLAESPNVFVLDDHHRLETGRPLPVCGNTAAMLTDTRYHRHFRVVGDRSRHYGLFACGPQTQADDDSCIAGGSCC